MEYHKIVAVTGLPGLYELINSKTDGAIVRSLDDKSTRFVSSRVHNFSHLESIEVFTTRDNVNLVEILNAMDAAKEKLPDEKNNDALKAYFKKVYPELDFDRVYSSDLKKMVKWFSVLKNNEVEIKLSAPPEEVAEAEEVEEVEEKVKTEKPAPVEKETTKPKKEAKKKEPEPEVKEVKKEKPAKAATKSAKETKAEPKAAPKKKAKEEAKPKKSAPAKKKSGK